MRSLAIINKKGGSGKTTTSVNLAATLAEQGRRVLLIDMDPQASASRWYRVKDAGRGIADIYLHNRPLKELIRATQSAGVEVVPASDWLVGAQRRLTWEEEGMTIFRRAMQKLPRQRWDYVLVDCPPSLGILTANALIAVREAVIPVEAHHLALTGMDRVITTVKMLKGRLNPQLRITGILACRVHSHTRLARQVVSHLRQRFGPLMYRVVIRENVRLAECPITGRPITQYASRSFGAEDYRALAKEVIGQEKK